MFPRNFEAMFQICLFCLWSTLLRMSEGYYTQQWVVHVPGGKSVVESLAKDHDFVNLGEIFPDYYHFQHRKVAKRSIAPHAGKKVLLAADTRVKWFQQQKAKRRIKRDLKLQDSDPRWPSMWYLNRGNGLDMNVIPAWLEGITGKGAVVTILDDGLEKDHPDLIQNYDPMASYDVNNQDSDPSPRYDMIDSNRHGTRCAGEVAATSNNSVCALGVAHGAQVGGVRMLDGDVTDAVEARSLSLNPQHIDIYSASWGPDDDGKTVDGPGELATRAFMEGVQKGRNGKGSIFIWASGNGGREHDNCNCDGYTNSIYSLSISSATEQGHVPWYSEACSSTLASTYSSGAVGEKQVVTTDLHHSCTSSHTGTSASAPLAAGICALALEANPNLTWRDMQHIVVRTARPQHLITSDWQTNGVGRNVSHSFGYGLMDAYAMVQLARKWATVPEQHKCEIIAPHVEKSIPARSVVILQLHVNECKGVQVLEHVQAKLTIFSQRRGDLNIQLISPMKTRVTLLAHRPQDISRQGFSHWPFMSVHSWGESPLGIWQLEIHNDGRLLGRATLQNWSLILYGTKQFDPTENNSDVLNHNKVKLYPKKKKSNKNKQRNEKKSTKSPNMLSKGKASKSKNKNYFSTPKYFSPINLYSHSNKKKFPKPTEGGNYFYAVNNSKFRNAGQGVKEYLKFVKNITITYPVMIPAPDSIKSRDSFRKLQKQKEKSRDINSNSNDKLFTTKPSTSVSTPVAKLTAKPWDKTTADIKAWELVLYGTETPPAIDTVNTDGSLNTNEPPSVEIQSNAIDNDLPLRSWTGDSEIKKDTSEVEEGVPRINAISGCEKTNGHICIECSGGFYEFNGKCVSTCPEKYYPSTLDSKSKETAEEINILRNVCLQCHYTCRRCSGSNDYQCIECYPDAALTNVSAIEIYCYPLSMTNRIEDEKWYFRSFVLLCIVIALAICVVGLLFYMNNRDRSSKRKYKFYKKNVLQNIRNMEETVKTAVYSDSE